MRRRSNKGTYLIIALICLILLNIGSMTIFLARSSQPLLVFKELILEVFSLSQDIRAVEDEGKEVDSELEQHKIDREKDLIINEPPYIL